MKQDKAVRATLRAAKDKQSRTSGILQQHARRIPKESYQHLKFSDRVAFNGLAEEQFVLLLCRLLEEQPGHTLPIWNVYQEASYELGISSETVKRYLLKHSARRAEFCSFGKIVYVNPNYVPPEGKEPEPPEDV